MKHSTFFLSVLFLLAVLLLPACAPKESTAEKVAPSVAEPIEGSDFKRVTLTQKAAERLDIQTAQVRNEQVNGSQHKVIPYAAVMYGLEGETWAYTNPEPLVFIRQTIVIDYIEGDLAVLSEGPEAGTEVVTLGAAMLYGAEVGVSK